MLVIDNKDFSVFYKTEKGYVIVKKFKEVFYFLEKEFKLFKIDSSKFLSSYQKSIREEIDLLESLSESHIEEVENFFIKDLNFLTNKKED